MSQASPLAAADGPPVETVSSPENTARTTAHSKVWYRLLHISDPHFPNCPGGELPARQCGRAQAAAVIQAVEAWTRWKERPFIDLAILSGDFTFQHVEPGFAAAEALIRGLSGSEKVNAILLTPGNHDIDLGRPEYIQELSLPTAKDKVESAYRKFVSRVLPGHAPEPYLADICKIAPPKGARHPGLTVAGLNSCRVERRDAQGWGYVGLDQIWDVGTNLLERLKGAPHFLVLVMHHNPLPIWDLALEETSRLPGSRKFSFLMDAAAVLKAVTDLGVPLLLHGHSHIRSFRRADGYGADSNSVPPVILGAGTLGLLPCDEGHHFQVIDICSPAQSPRPGDVLRNEHRFRRDTGPVVMFSGSAVVNYHHFYRLPGAKGEGEWRYVDGRDGLCPISPWDQQAAQAILKDMVFEAQQAKKHIQIYESWARLRAYKTPSWKSALPAICRRVGKMAHVSPDPGPALVNQYIRRLVQSPPKEMHLCSWTLEEYIAQAIQYEGAPKARAVKR